VSTDIWPTIHAERVALADDLAGVTGERWHTPSLCSEWDVHQVLAHLVASAKMTPARFLTLFASARFSFDRFTTTQVAAESAGGPVATLAAFREAAPRSSAPPGPKETWLGEAFVHGEDIRRPLGISHDYPVAEVVRALGFYASSNAIIGGKTRVAGVTLKPTDADAFIGSGPVVEGPAISLLLAASGRPSALDELSGPGLEVLRSRF
jgi:uncharacterized protein (TIGR03083 family)